MFHYNIYFTILFVITYDFKYVDSRHQCEHLKGVFSSKNGAFFVCAIQYSEPVKYCQKCVDPYLLNIEAYKNLSNGFDDDNVTLCKNIYFDKNRLNIIELLYQKSVDLWEMGFCKECYDWNDSIHNQTIRNSTKEFINYIHNTNNCIELKLKDDVCEHCSKDYNLLNDFYNSMKKALNNKICFDITDIMNKTRLHWSKDLNCCKDRDFSPNINFIVVGSILLAIIICFYVGCFIYRRRRQSYDTLNSDNDPIMNSNNSQYSSLPDNNNASNSIGNKNVNTKNFNTFDSDDSDQEILSSTPPVRNLIDC